MYKISCLTTGDCIKLPQTLVWSVRSQLPKEIADQCTVCDKQSFWEELTKPDTSWSYCEFRTEEAAKWFIVHKLVYNPRRKDPNKLAFMKTLFEFNNIFGWQTVKLEFEIVKI